MPFEDLVAYGVLASIVLLLVLLVRARQSPAVLFAFWAGAYLMLGLVDQKVFLSGFTNPALATLVVLLLVSLALERSPMLDGLSDALIRGRPEAATLRLSSVTIPFSSFLNNTAVVGALLGVVVRQRRVPASKLLIPLSYASIFGGITTLVGTSTNLVVDSFTVNAGLPGLEMVQFAWVGVPTAIMCMVILVLVSRLLPDHEGHVNENGTAYFLEAQLLPDSALVGKTIEENSLRGLEGLFLVEILREGRLISPVSPDEVLVPNDVLIFSGETQKVQILQRFQGLRVFGAQTDLLLGSNLVEVIISNESVLANRTLREVDFRSLFDAGVVGIRRGERRLTGQLGRIRLRVGDSLLLAVGSDFWRHRNIDRNFHVLDNSLQRPRLSRRENVVALGGFMAVIALAALEWISLLKGLLALLAILVINGTLSLGELRRRFPFELVVVIGSALVIANTLETTGTARLLAELMRQLFSDYGAYGALIGIYLLTMLLTELVTNNAAAAIAFPIALSTARMLGVDPMPFVMTVAYGASACFMMPFGYQTHLMVYSPGRYRIVDFLRVGLPVSLVYGACVLTLVPVFFPF